MAGRRPRLSLARPGQTRKLDDQRDLNRSSPNLTIAPQTDLHHNTTDRSKWGSIMLWKMKSKKTESRERETEGSIIRAARIGKWKVQQPGLIPKTPLRSATIEPAPQQTYGGGLHGFPSDTGRPEHGEPGYQREHGEPQEPSLLKGTKEDTSESDSSSPSISLHSDGPPSSDEWAAAPKGPVGSIPTLNLSTDGGWTLAANEPRISKHMNTAGGCSMRGLK